MFEGAKARAGFRAVLRCVVVARPRASRRVRPVLVTAVGICLLFSLTASAPVGAGAAAGGVRANTTAATRFPLSVRQISARELRGRIVGTAAIVNTANVRVRSTTGVLGLSRGPGGSATGIRTFSVASLAPGSARRLRFTSGPVDILPVASGTYRVLICTDIYSQIQRFAQNTNCSLGGGVAISTVSPARPSGPVPNTIIGKGLASSSRSSAAAFRFVSTVSRSSFECSLDGGPWLACSSPRSYTALVDGPHAFRVRAVSPSGKVDPTPAHASWTVDTGVRAVTLRRPLSGSATNNNKPAFSGAAGTAPGDSSRIKIKVFSGKSTSGLPVQTLTASASGGNWSVAPTQPLAHGTYTAEAEQSDGAGTTETSAPSSFTINTTPARVRSLAVRAAGAASTPSAYSVGGSVAGLSGTVVLQDNGGDDLSVAGNGPFTFATPVASGGAYNVTVKSNPSGQTCTVSGAAGTVASANVTSVAVTCATSTATSASDNFNRANGGLGAGWAAISDGGLSIVSQQLVGTAATAGDVRVAESYGSDQYSKVEVTSTQLSGGQWVGPAVRSQNGGQDTYLGMYFWNSGTPQLRLYKRTAGNWVQLGNSYNSGPLPAGTQLTLSAVGSRLSLQQNGVERIAATDTTLTGGAPGIITFGAATADNWAGGTGTPPPPSTYSIGGSVAGLSGTVVLQDNGGDDLSVAGNGPFTFATPVASGGAYNVTVKSNPSGQTCTVSGGAGTVASANVTSVAVTCATSTATSASDNFNRANGGLGAGWAAISDGGLSIVSQQVVGTAATAGDVRVAESYGSDQYSKVEVTSTQLSGGQWVGPAVRSQNGGQDTYLGIVLLEQRHPAAAALQAHRRQLGAARQQLQQRPAARRHAAHAQRRRLEALLAAKRGRADRRDRHHADRRRPRDHHLRRRHGRQLGRRHRDPAAAEHVLDRGERGGAVGDGGVAGQRR